MAHWGPSGGATAGGADASNTNAQERGPHLSKRAGAPPTIVDVAKKAGVSIKTVSRVMNKESTVHPDTRALVLQVVLVVVAGQRLLLGQ